MVAVAAAAAVAAFEHDVTVGASGCASPSRGRGWTCRSMERDTNVDV